MAYSTETQKIDKAAVDGMSGIADSLGYLIDVMESHHHSTELCYGNSSNAMAENTPIKFTVIGGNNAWGTELLLTDGTVIESGSATKKFDLNTLYVVSVDTANKISNVQFRSGVKGTALTSVTTTDAGDLFTKVGHGLSNGNTVFLSSIVSTTGINAYTVYYVVGVNGNDFQVSLTSGGGAVTLTTDGSCTVTPLTQTILTTNPISMAATNSNSMPFAMISPRVACNTTISVRALSETGSTISIGFLLGLHTYTA